MWVPSGPAIQSGSLVGAEEEEEGVVTCDLERRIDLDVVSIGGLALVEVEIGRVVFLVLLVGMPLRV